MSQENVEIVGRIYALGLDYVIFNDPEATEELMGGFRPLYDPEFEFHAIVPGGEVVQHGIDAYLEFMRDWLTPWESYAIKADEIRDVEPDRVAVFVSHHGRLKDNAGEVRTRGVDLWTLRDGRFLRLDAYMDRTEGVRAAGLSA